MTRKFHFRRRNLEDVRPMPRKLIARINKRLTQTSTKKAWSEWFVKFWCRKCVKIGLLIGLFVFFLYLWSGGEIESMVDISEDLQESAEGLINEDDGQQLVSTSVSLQSTITGNNSPPGGVTPTVNRRVIGNYQSSGVVDVFDDNSVGMYPVADYVTKAIGPRESTDVFVSVLMIQIVGASFLAYFVLHELSKLPFSLIKNEYENWKFIFTKKRWWPVSVANFCLVRRIRQRLLQLKTELFFEDVPPADHRPSVSGKKKKNKRKVSKRKSRAKTDDENSLN